LISARTRLAAIIGSPVSHSLSPALHNAGFAATGVDWVYTAFEVNEGRAEAALDAMRVLGIAGLSITMPHKEAVADLVDELDPAAATLRSVNTVVPLGDGRLKGYSTDGAGFVAALAEEGVDVSGRSICVLGAGGAARAIIDAVARAGAKSITVVNRSADRAAAAAAIGGAIAGVDTADAVRECDIVVNATSVGMGTTDLPIDPALLGDALVVADIVYHPRRTALLDAAARRGARPIDGLGMLVHQAVLQQQLWTGVAPDPSVLRVAAERELSGAGQ
jgi:shikimate dehydrogenase